MAEDIKKHVESGKTGLPNSLTYDRVTYTWADMMYVMPYILIHQTSDCQIPDIKKPADAWAGNNIDEQVKKDDFFQQAKNIINYWMKHNNTIPNYVTTIKTGKKVNANLYTYCFAKILVFYKNHNKTMPLTCRYCSSDMKRATNTTGKYGHSTKSGCDNMGQNNSVNCGPHSMQECIRNLTGIVVPQSTLASWAGTGSGGSSHAGLETAIAKFNKTYDKNLKVTWKNFSELGWNGIKKIVESKNQDCIIHSLYRNQWGHYEVVNTVSTNINVQNSLGNKCNNGCYCGYIEYRTQSTFRSYIGGISQKSIMVITDA